MESAILTLAIHRIKCVGVEPWRFSVRGREVVHLNSLTYRLCRSYIYLCIYIYFIYNLCNIDAFFFLISIEVLQSANENIRSSSPWRVRNVFFNNLLLVNSVLAKQTNKKIKRKKNQIKKDKQKSTQQCHLQKYPTLVIATFWLPQQQLNIVMKYYHRVKSTSYFFFVENFFSFFFGKMSSIQ